MKKFLIALLAVLLLVSFTSCDTQKKINEAVAEEEAKAAEAKEALISFIGTYNAAEKYDDYLYNDACDLDLSKDNSYAQILVKRYLSNPDSFKEIKKAAGTVKVEKSEDNYKATVTFTGVNISFSYTQGKKETTETLTLDGVIYQVFSFVDENNGTKEYKVTGLKENGIEYKDIEFLQTAVDGEMTFTTATCDGKNVDVDILDTIYPNN